jgi:signal transduction histidine kinase
MVEQKYLKQDRMPEVYQMIPDVGALENQRRLLELALHDSEEELQQLERMVGAANLAKGIAHHFSNIMTIVTGYGSMMQQALRKDDPLRAYVDRILVASERAAQLTRRLTDLSGQMTIKPRPANLNDIVRRAERLFSRYASDGIKIEVDLTDKDLPVLADFLRMEEVLMSLITNACEAMADGGTVTVATDYVAFGDGESGVCAHLLVKDTGGGMDRNKTVKAFEPFYTTKGNLTHMGLGLPIAYGIIKRHHGSMSLESKPGQGTTAKIYLPLCSSGTAQVEAIPVVPSPLTKRLSLCRG